MFKRMDSAFRFNLNLVNLVSEFAPLYIKACFDDRNVFHTASEIFLSTFGETEPGRADGGASCRVVESHWFNAPQV